MGFRPPPVESGSDASTTVKGVTKLSTAPVDAAQPIAVGDNDVRNTNARTPADGSVTDAKIATTLSPSKITGTAVVTADARLSDARAPTTHTHPESDVTSLVADLAAKANSIETVNTNAAAGSTETLPDVGTATIHRLTLDAATCTLTFPSAAAGKSFTVILAQDAAGGRLVTWPAVLWPSGSTPALTTTPAKRDVFSFLCADGTNWLGFVAGQNL